MLLNLWSSKRSFKPYQNAHDLVKEAGVKGKNHVILNQKVSRKILLDYLLSNRTILKASPKAFLTKMKGIKLMIPAKEKKPDNQISIIYFFNKEG